MISRRALMALLVCILGASTMACGQSSDSTKSSSGTEAPAAASGSTAPTAPTGTAAPAATTPPGTNAPSASAAAPSTAPSTQNDAATPNPGSTDSNHDNGTTVTKKLFCPEVGKLKKVNMFWGAPGGWRSYSESFVNVIDSFSGAQWIGVNVGKMVCVYRSKSTFEFPVVLQNDTLTPIPEGDKWTITKEGYRNCISSDIYACPFKFEEQKSGPTNVYKELDFFKNKKDYLENSDHNPSN